MHSVKNLHEGIISQDSSAPLAIKVGVPARRLLTEGGPQAASVKYYTYIQLDALPIDFQERIRTFIAMNAI